MTQKKQIEKVLHIKINRKTQLSSASGQFARCVDATVRVVVKKCVSVHSFLISFCVHKPTEVVKSFGKYVKWFRSLQS